MARSVSACRGCVLFLGALFVLYVCAPAGQTLSCAGDVVPAAPPGWFRCPAGAGARSQPFTGDGQRGGLHSRSVPSEHTGVREPPRQERPCRGFQTCAAPPRPRAHRHLTNCRELKSQQKVFSRSLCLTPPCSPSCRAKTSPIAGESTMSTAPSRATSRSSIT